MGLHLIFFQKNWKGKGLETPGTGRGQMGWPRIGEAQVEWSRIGGARVGWPRIGGARMEWSSEATVDWPKSTDSTNILTHHPLWAAGHQGESWRQD